MRTGYGLVVGVLAAVLAGTGCCKLCDWCCLGPRDAQKINEGPPPEEHYVPYQPTGGNPPAAPAAGAKPAARTGPTGAYGGTGN